MSTHFYPLRVAAVDKTTDDCTVIALQVTPDLKEQFRYRQGQYLTFRVVLDGEEVRRSYSLCSSPLDNEWRVAIKRIEGGRFSTYANEVLQPGDVLETMPPAGRFFVELVPGAARQYVAFAAGSGITPILSIIKTHLEAEPNSSFKLCYVNQRVSSIILKEEVEALKNQFLDRFEIFHFLTRESRQAPLFNGRIDRDKLDTLFRVLLDRDHIDDYFICGPNEMIFLIRDYLTERGVDRKHIHFELFNTDGIVVRRPTVRPLDTSVRTEVYIREGGKDFYFSMPRASDNLLDAALSQQADLPFACKGGVCCTCRALLVEGEVDVQVNYGLEPEEIAAGYILTCQSVPTSERVVVDFDASIGKH